jgi:hypothetical protein
MSIVHEIAIGKFFSRPDERRFAIILTDGLVYGMVDYKLDLSVKSLPLDEIPRVFEQPPKNIEPHGDSIRVVIEYKQNQVIINFTKCGIIGGGGYEY